MTRRALLQQAGLGALGLAAVGPALIGAEATPPKKSNAPAPSGAPGDLAPLNRFGRMMQEFYVARVREVERAANARRAALRTRSDAEAYVRDVRAKAQQCFGPWPAKTPLNARVTRIIERDTYRIENVIFDSRPGFPVTANLYVPKGRAGKLPGVVGTCGHSANGKAAEAYQSFAQGLARLGYVCLIYDPVGQGERLQCVGPDLKPRHGIGTAEHLHVGNQQFLVGEFIGAWMAWDGIRALDYLLSRPEVDPQHVGVTGNSGGGTQTTWLCAADPRWTMAAPSCFVTTFRRNLENELPADTEQCPPRALALGLDHSDFIAAMAPRPVILLGGERDYFDARGLEEAFARLKNLYRLLGAEENIQLFIGPNPHGYTQVNREAMYGWFNRQTKISTTSTEPAITIEKDETLLCTARGQVGEASPATVFTATRDLARSLAAKRARPEGAELRRAVAEVLKLPARDASAPPDYRILRPSSGRRYPKRYAGTYAVETEPGVHAIVYRLSDVDLVSRPARDAKRAILYVAHHSADAELRREPLIAEVMAAEPASAVFACDVRGVGESLPTTTGQSSLAPYGSDYFYAIHGLMLGAPYAGQKTHDVLRVVDWLRAQGHGEVHLVARGWGALPATFAAVISDGITQVTLKNALTSYDDIAQNEAYRWPLSCLVPDVLKSFDLPDCYRALAAKKPRQIEPWGAMAGRARAPRGQGS
ncbi:MAG: acetylxylan esterase [Opitutaceae bacterium]|nr:acetylxylan esterase [Opitutaceae bacterium]